MNACGDGWDGIQQARQAREVGVRILANDARLRGRIGDIRRHNDRPRARLLQQFTVAAVGEKRNVRGTSGFQGGDLRNHDVGIAYQLAAETLHDIG
jgi:hypothetical protein